MASNYYMGDAYLASLASGAGVGPDEPTNNYKLMQQRNDLIEIRNKLYLGLNSELARYERQQLATEAKLFENVNTTRAKVFESLQQNKRISAKNATDVKEALLDTQTALRLKVEGDAPAFDSIDRAYRNPAQGQSQIQSAVAETLSWKDAFGNPLSRGNSEIGGVMNRLATRALPNRQDISRITRDEFLNSLGNITDAQRIQIGELFDAGQERFNEITGALATVDESLSTVSGIEQSLGHTGVSEDPALISQLNNVAASLGPAVSRGIGRSAADIAATQEMFLENNKELQRQQGYIDAMDAKKGRAGMQARIGRIVANPEFRAWAEGNGFRLGSATVQEDGTVTYAPMRDDTKAIALFRYQSETGKHGPMLASTSTDKTVRVTYEDPESREKALATYGKNGQFFMNEAGELMTPAEAERAMNPGNTVQVGFGSDNNPVFKLPDGRTVSQAGEAASAEGVQFMPATISTESGGTRYLVPSDLEGMDISKVGAVETPAEAQAASKGSAERDGIRVTDEAGAREAWTGVVVGKLDRPNARRIIEEGAGYISLDGGKVTIPAAAKATIEVMPRGGEEGTMTVAERLAEADRAAADEPARAASARAEVPTVTVPNVTAGGVTGTLNVPATSTAALTAMAEGRPVTPVAEKGAAPAAGATAPAPAGAAVEKAYWKDDKGNTFEIGDGITWISDKDGKAPPKGKKTEFKDGDPALTAVAKKLKAEGQRVEAPTAAAEKSAAPAQPEVATGKPAAERLAEARRAPSMREPEPEPTIGRRAKAAVVVYPEAEGEKKPGILEKARALFSRRKKAGEEGEDLPAASAKGGAPEATGTAPAAEVGAGTSKGASTDEAAKLKRRSMLTDLVAGAAAGVPERAPNAAVPPTFEERAKVAPGQFQMGQAAAGARGEGPSTLKVGDLSRRGEDTEPVAGTVYGPRSADKKVAAGVQDLMAQRTKEQASALTTAQEADLNQRVAERKLQVASGRPGLSTFNQYRQRAFPTAAQE